MRSKLQTRTMFPQVVPLDHEHDECVEFFMTVDDAYEVSRVALGEDLRESM